MLRENLRTLPIHEVQLVPWDIDVLAWEWFFLVKKIQAKALLLDQVKGGFHVRKGKTLSHFGGFIYLQILSFIEFVSEELLRCSNGC